MANTHSNLIDSLSALDRVTFSAGEKHNLCVQACRLIRGSELADEDKDSVIETVQIASNPSGWKEVSTGIKAGIKALQDLREAATVAASTTTEDDSTTEVVSVPVLNVVNFTNLVKDGTIFSVEFTKRTTGERRKMQCRLGVKKHLKGGTKAYDAKSKGLITVYDLQAKGYRSIPVDAVLRLNVHGQQFKLGEVA